MAIVVSPSEAILNLVCALGKLGIDFDSVNETHCVVHFRYRYLGGTFNCAAGGTLASESIHPSGSIQEVRVSFPRSGVPPLDLTSPPVATWWLNDKGKVWFCRYASAETFFVVLDRLICDCKAARLRPGHTIDD